MSKPVFGRVKNRDLWRCRVCGTASDLQVHHIVYRSQGGPDEEWNLITLCGNHHREAHDGYIAKYELHMLARVPLIRLETARRALRGNATSELKTCLSCENRAGMECLMFEQDISWDYSCPYWTLREG